ncbi:MAG: hypothetical protein A2X64_08725 [Ignavibacteria bacterium GWF2_33_9]|nr:MAG: hypothetical protein A2X64_08725 [Ignavibacteria bacterium GWF2_33_9]
MENANHNDVKTKISKKKYSNSSSCGGGAVYGLGIIGALFYFLSTASTFWIGVLGVLKAIVWPAIFVYEIFKYLQI